MRAVVFEHGITGHYLAYMPPLLSALQAVTEDLALVCQAKAPGTPEYAQYVEPFEGRVEVLPVLPAGRQGALRNAWDRLRMFRQTLKDVRFDHFYLPRADGVSQLLGTLRSVGAARRYARLPIEGLVMQSRFAYQALQGGLTLRGKLARRAMEHAPWRTLHHLDPIAYNHLVDRDGPVRPRLRMMPDPVPSGLGCGAAEARRRLELPEGGRYVGCVGGIDARKGCDLLVRAFAAADLGPDDRLLLAGRCRPDVQQAIDQEAGDLVRRGRVIQIDRFLSDEEMALAIESLDVVATPYPRHIGSASIVIRAAAASKPVLGSDFGWIGWVVPRFGLGRTCRVTDIEAFSDAIVRSLVDAGGHVPDEPARRFVKFHTRENFAACWTHDLRERMGLDADPAHVDWDWVVEPLEDRR